MLLDQHLRQLEEGQCEYIVLGSLEREVRQALGDNVKPEVFLSQQSYRHIRERHGNQLTDLDYDALPDAIHSGMVVEDPRRGSLAISFNGPRKRYAVFLKVAKNGRVYLQTMYPTRDRYTETICSRGRLLRPHK